MASLREEAQRIQETKAPPQGPVFAKTSSWTADGGDGATFILPPGAGIGELADLLRERGLDPDDWHVERVTFNEWDALTRVVTEDGQQTVKLRQLKVTLRNRQLALGPAHEVERRYRPRPGQRTPPKRKPRVTAVFSDQHAPYHDQALHEKVLQWLSTVQPYEFIVAGDTGDYPDISRHRPKRRFHASVKEVGQGSYRILSDYVDASHKSRRRFMRGNHDYRLEAYLIDKAPELADVTPADRGDGVKYPPLFSIRNLLHLDALGYVLEGEEGDSWEFGEAEVIPGHYVRHQPLPQKNVPRLAGSFTVGHTHRQGIEALRVRDGNRVWRTDWTIHNGCMCELSDGLGYAIDAEWQQGFSTSTVWPDGSVSYDLATYDGKNLTWKGERW